MAPPNAAAVAGLISSISRAGDDFSNEAPGSRVSLMSLAEELIAQLQTPAEVIQRVGFTEPARFAAMKVAVDLEVFEQLKANEGPVTSQELAKTAKADPVVVARMMKHLAATKILHETSPDTYQSTDLTNAFTEPRFRDGITYMYRVGRVAVSAIPEYLKASSWQNPKDPANCPFQTGLGTTVPFWVYLNDYPDLLSCFNNYMAGYRQGRPSWCDEGFFPVTKKLTSSETDVVVVDVGGGMGHDLEEFRAKHEDFIGKRRMVLQDRKEVIDSLSGLSSKIEPTVHDFFTEQPIKGANAYLLHSVLHDWGDDDCRKILEKLRDALQPGVSRILVNDFMVPSSKADWRATSMDLLMMALGAVKERTQEDWETLVESVDGLKIERIWGVSGDTESVIEVVKSS